jgi:release factor glutamine methyltransferase
MKPVRINSFILAIAKQLEGEYQTHEQSIRHAWDLIEKLMNQTRVALIAQEKIILTQHQEQLLQHWIEAITKQHMPIQYILGSVPFDDVEILIRPPILIPRPETEYWCMQIIQQLHRLKNKKIGILDLCAGSGCIALACAKALPEAVVYASDISQDALNLAQENAAYNNITNITFVLSNLFERIPDNVRFDLIVSNPPYIAESEWTDLDLAVTQWEDKTALIAGSNGLALIQKIIAQAPRWLHNNSQMQKQNIPQLVIEIGETQANVVRQLMIHNGFKDVEVKKDLAGKDRYVCGRVDYDQTFAPT